MSDLNYLFGEVIHSYTRAQAIEDGVLIDVSDTAKEAGITFPVALTASVWAEFVVVPEGVDCQDEAGRLWDVMMMTRYAAKRANGPQMLVEVMVANTNGKPRKVTLKALCGPGDNMEPVITIMQLHED